MEITSPPPVLRFKSLADLLQKYEELFVGRNLRCPRGIEVVFEPYHFFHLVKLRKGHQTEFLMSEEREAILATVSSFGPYSIDQRRAETPSLDTGRYSGAARNLRIQSEKDSRRSLHQRVPQVRLTIQSIASGQGGRLSETCYFYVSSTAWDQRASKGNPSLAETEKPPGMTAGWLQANCYRGRGFNLPTDLITCLV